MSLAYWGLLTAARISDGLVVASCDGNGIRSNFRTNNQGENVRIPGVCIHRWLQAVEVGSSVSIGD